jgi:hypothetical protein
LRSLLHIIFHQLSLKLGENFRAHPEKVIEEFSLTKTLTSCFQQASVSAPESHLSSEDKAEDVLLRIMLAHNSFFLELPDAKEGDAHIKRLLTDSGARDFLHIHQSEDIEWFNKERFEELLKALFLTGICTLATEGIASPEMVSEALRINKLVREYSDRAEKSGYRTLHFLHGCKSDSSTAGDPSNITRNKI